MGALLVISLPESGALAAQRRVVLSLISAMAKSRATIFVEGVGHIMAPVFNEELFDESSRFGEGGSTIGSAARLGGEEISRFCSGLEISIEELSAITLIPAIQLKRLVASGSKFSDDSLNIRFSRLRRICVEVLKFYRVVLDSRHRRRRERNEEAKEWTEQLSEHEQRQARKRTLARDHKRWRKLRADAKRRAEKRFARNAEAKGDRRSAEINEAAIERSRLAERARYHATLKLLRKKNPEALKKWRYDEPKKRPMPKKARPDTVKHQREMRRREPKCR